MGADSFLGLRQWHRAAEIPFAATLIVASRPGQSLDDVSAGLPAGLTIESAPQLPSRTNNPSIQIRCFRLRSSAGEVAPFFLLPDVYVEISATEIRKRIRTGTAADLLPATVADYIRSHKLYRQA